ncbi:MAG: hypothetical protein M1813_000746 [Trichoglossum hirsutum]|nr:MAG: hypothetical protein M1813_000746 [Trichoglossum hirsutum]
MQVAPPPVSILGRYRILAPTASVRVSPICLGTMNFGEAWQSMMGECSKDTAFEMMDFFHEQGGNFIDTSNNYQEQQSEIWVGEWMEKRGNRDEIVLATKFTMGHRNNEPIPINFGGNSTKSLHVSVNASLKKLRTDYIDLLYLHWWDFTTSIPEIMQSLNSLILAGKVLYLGISDTPAWVVSKANEYARNHGLRQFSVYEGNWSAAMRDMERDIIPMCQAEGMGITPWGALGGGHFKSESERQKLEGRNMPGGPSEKEIKVSTVLEMIAEKHKTLITSVALSYIMHKVPYVFPICGGRKLSHLKSNIEALHLELSPEDIDEIESAVPFDTGFPHNFLGGGPKGAKGPGDVVFLRASGILDVVQETKPIPPPHKT